MFKKIKSSSLLLRSGIIFVLTIMGLQLGILAFLPSKSSAVLDPGGGVVVSETLSEDQLLEIGKKVLKLEAFKLCVANSNSMRTDGISSTEGPLRYSPTENSKSVGHAVDAVDGRWSCETEDGARTETWFKLLLMNGSNTTYYSGWKSGEKSRRYIAPSSDNLFLFGDSGYFFVNKDNVNKSDSSDWNYLEGDFLGESDAKTKITSQIDKTIAVLLNGLSDSQKKAIRYLTLGENFFNQNACNAKPIEALYEANGSDTAMVGSQLYTVSNDGQGLGRGAIAVGHGQFGYGTVGETNCSEIAKEMGIVESSYKSATGNTSQQPTSTSTDTDGTSGNDGVDDSCESQTGLSAFFMCPMISMISSGLAWIDRQMTNLLVVDSQKYATGQSGDQMYEAWTKFRNIGITLLLAAMLVMVVSTALGIGALDAYTVKKAFPRMVAAVIFMMLSWYICIFLITATNTIGKGVLGLMTSPFPNVTSLASLFEASSVAGGAVKVIGGGITFVGTLFLAKGAAGLLLGYLGSGFLILIIAFVTLVARQMFIIVLILGAPIAILSWIFPGNDKLWKIWWQSFSKLLIMFPMVMALIASGRIFASVVLTTSVGNDAPLLDTLLKFSAYVIPYAFIPLTFKAAGGAFGNLVGMVNDRSRGAFDRLKKRRQASWDGIKKNAKGGDILRFGGGEGRFGQAISSANRGIERVGTGAKGRFGIGARGRKAVTYGNAARAEEALKSNPSLQQAINSDDDAAMLLGLSGGTAAGGRAAQARLEQEFIRQAQETAQREGRQVTADELNTARDRAGRAYAGASAIGFTRSNATAALQGAVGNKARALGAGSFDILDEGLGRLSGGNDEQHQIGAYGLQYNARQGQRVDLGGDWTNPAYENMTADERERAVFYDGVKRTGVSAFIAGHGNSTLQAGTMIAADYASGDQERSRDATVLLSELHGQLAAGATGDARDNIIRIMQDNGIDLNHTAEEINVDLAQRAGISVEELNNRKRAWATQTQPGQRTPTPGQP